MEVAAEAVAHELGSAAETVAHEWGSAAKAVAQELGPTSWGRWQRWTAHELKVGAGVVAHQLVCHLWSLPSIQPDDLQDVKCNG